MNHSVKLAVAGGLLAILVWALYPGGPEGRVGQDSRPSDSPNVEVVTVIFRGGGGTIQTRVTMDVLCY
ncbi:MAG: hypothetical protein P8J37_11415 [Fuerstiella sp.]|nr:hypothetical protein [Fuerstiella sp.]